MKQNPETPGHTVLASSAAALPVAGADAIAPIPFSLSPMTPATTNRLAVQAVRAQELSHRAGSTRRNRDQMEDESDNDNDNEDEDEENQDQHPLPFAASGVGIKGTPGYRRAMNGMNMRIRSKQAKKTKV